MKTGIYIVDILTHSMSTYQCLVTKVEDSAQAEKVAKDYFCQHSAEEDIESISSDEIEFDLENGKLFWIG